MANPAGVEPLDAVRIERLMAGMSREEKLAQLVGLWLILEPRSGRISPYEAELPSDRPDQATVDERLRLGLGQVTRALGSTPVEAGAGAAMIDELQRRLREETPAGIPAIVHEECLSGLMALGATAFPCPLNWGSTWDPDLITQMATAIRDQMVAVGARQGLAPVLDVVRDARWGRVEECIGEDPYLVGVIGCAYIRGLQGPDLRTGVAATAKHFAGHSFSEGGRNLAPAHVGQREMTDVFLLPFEMAVAEGVASIMNAYHDIDGVPAAASRELLTTLLRDEWGFDGVVVSDYFSIAFLHSLHATAADKAEAAAMALRAGIDVELPNADCYGSPLVEALDRGAIDEHAVDIAVRRVLSLKARLGLFGSPSPAVEQPPDLDPPAHRDLARAVAERSLILLKNDGAVLPLDPALDAVAVIGPNADHAAALLGNYTFTNHVASHFENPPPGVGVATVLDEIRAAVSPRTRVDYTQGCPVTGDDRSGFADAIALASAASAAVVVVGDQAGHFGSGTSGEGTDTDDLRLPGLQQDLIDAVAGTGTPTVVVLVTGRPYAIAEVAERVPAIVEAWFPGEEGAAAIARLLFGAIEPQGRTGVTFSRGAGQQPRYYNAKRLGHTGYARSTTRAVFPFGHGLTYTSFEYGSLHIDPQVVPLDGVISVTCTILNNGHRPGREVVQLYVSDRAASVSRPFIELKGFGGVELEPGGQATVRFTLPADVLSFSGPSYQRVLEPGAVDVLIGASSAEMRLRGRIELVGTGPRVLGHQRAMTTTFEVIQPA